MRTSRLALVAFAAVAALYIAGPAVATILAGGGQAVPPPHPAPAVARTRTATSSPTAAQTPYSHPKLDPKHPAGVYRLPLLGWWHNDTGSLEYRLPPPGKLKAFRSDDIGRCLAGKDVAFVGDAVMYQLLTAILIHLDSGAPADPVHPRMENRLRNSMRMDYWDCDTGFACDFTSAQNLYYHNRKYRVNATFLYLGDAASGHNPIGHALLMEGKAHPGFEEAFAWRDVDMAALADVARRGLPPFDMLFVNSGLHKLPEFLEEGSAREAMQGFGAAMKRGAVPVWITTTLEPAHMEDFTVPLLSNLTALEPGARAALTLGWRVFDRRATLKTLLMQLKRQGRSRDMERLLYVNEWEFQPFLVTQVANLLLNTVCGKKKA